MVQLIKEKGFFWVGMALAIIIVLLGLRFSRETLMQQEANRYGQELTERLGNIVYQLDGEVSKTLTPDLYQKLHQKPLAKLPFNQIEKIQSGISHLATIVHSLHGAVALFTDCPETEKALCYEQFTPDAIRKEHVVREGYDPKSRPWYIATRSHTDWVVLHFMIRSRSRETGYPTTWGVGLAKHILGSPAEQRALEARARDKGSFALQLKEEPGLWLLLSFATSNLEALPVTNKIPTYPFLHMLYEGKPHPFNSFDVSLKTLRFSKEMLEALDLLDVRCQSITEPKGLSYKAHVICHLNNESIRFVFSKVYDSPVYFLIITLFGFFVLYGAFRFLSFFYQQNLLFAQSREKQRITMLLEKRSQFPQVDNHDLLALDKGAYQKFIKETYGSFPTMAKKRGLDLNHIYRVNRKFKGKSYLVFKYDTIREILGIYDSEKCNEQIKKLLCAPQVLKKVLK